MLAIFVTLIALASAQNVHIADLILRRGAVSTSDAARSWVESAAMANGRIIFGDQ